MAQSESMKFVLEVDFEDATAAEEVASELGRILRYWGGSMKQVDLKPGMEQAIYDSSYREVGKWRLVQSNQAG